MSISKISIKLCKVWIFESKNPLFGSKSLEKVQKSLEIGFSKHSEILEIFLFRNFQKLQKMTLNSNFRNRKKKTCFNSKTNSKVRLKVWNAWPQSQLYKVFSATVKCWKVRVGCANFLTYSKYFFSSKNHVESFLTVFYFNFKEREKGKKVNQYFTAGSGWIRILSL